MVGLDFDISARSALQQLRQPGRNNQTEFNNVVGGTLRGARRNAGVGFFTVSNQSRTESAIFRTLGDSLSTARGSIAAARAGAGALEGVLGRAEQLIGAVEAGAPGSAFTGALDNLQRTSDIAIARSGFNGTNLLEEGSNLTVTLGFNADGNGFRELNFTAVGLAATDAARAAAQTVTETVTETVETPVTRGERLAERQERLVARQERLGERLERLDARETRLESRLTNISERQERLGARVDRLERVETRINDRLEASGARPTDPRNQRLLDLARRVDDFADRLEERGSTRFAEFVGAVADRTAERAGLTISLDQLDRLENRLERVGDRIETTNTRIERLDERRNVVNERLTQVSERREATNERIDQTAARIDRITNRLETLSEERLNQVVATRTETVEREVTRQIESPLAGGFTDIVGAISERLQAGDTEGARAIVNEARERIGRVEDQLDQVSGALNRQGGFLGALTDRLDSQVRDRVDERLDEESAARVAAGVLSDLARTSRLFRSDEARGGVLELFNTGGTAAGEAQTDTGVVSDAEPENADTEDA